LSDYAKGLVPKEKEKYLEKLLKVDSADKWQAQTHKKRLNSYNTNLSIHYYASNKDAQYVLNEYYFYPWRITILTNIC
jgi:hypothetical protein